MLKKGMVLRTVTSFVGVIAFIGGLVLPGGAAAAESPPNLGVAESFAVLAGTGVTNTGPTVIDGDLGTCPTPAITGFPPGAVIGGSMHANDALACEAKADLVIAYNDAASRGPLVSYGGPTDVGGSTLLPGVYMSPSSLALTGTVSLDAQGDPNAVFVFQAGSTVVTASNSTVALVNGAQACNVYWQVGSSATLGTGTTFVGSVLALTSITANTNATIAGRLLARNGATTLDSNVITVPECAAIPTTTTAGDAPTTTTTVATTSTARVTATTAGVAPSTTLVSGDRPRGLTTATLAQVPPLATTTTDLTTNRTERLPETGMSAPRVALLGLAALSLGHATRRSTRHGAGRAAKPATTRLH